MDPLLRGRAKKECSIICMEDEELKRVFGWRMAN